MRLLVRARPLARVLMLMLALCALGMADHAPSDGAGLQDSTRDGPSFEEARRALREPWSDARARGVRALAEIGSDQAWGLVIECLEDGDARVADTAELALAGLPGGAVRDRLMGRDGLHSGNDLVRRRVARALGRMSGPLDGERLVAALDPRDPPGARAICRTLERAAHEHREQGDRQQGDRQHGDREHGDWQQEERLPEERLRGNRARMVRGLVRLLGSRMPQDLAADALAAIVALDPASGRREVEESLEDRRPRVRAAAVRLFEGPGERLRGALADEHSCVRMAAVGALAARRDSAGARALVARLGLEERSRIRERILGELRSLSGLRHGSDPRPWSDWARGLEPGWRPSPTLDRAERPATRTHAGLSTVPLSSDRFVMLVDFSGSLWAPRPDGRRRKDLLDVQVPQLLMRMPASSRFNLVPYATRPSPWKERLVEATARNKRSASRAFERCNLTGKGDLWGALQDQLADPEVDTILVVTDGAPTGGDCWDLGLLGELLEEECRWSSITVDMVLIDGSPGLHSRWREITSRTGGQLTAVRFDEAEEVRSP